jgi:hypothetical protein
MPIHTAFAVHIPCVAPAILFLIAGGVLCLIGIARMIAGR